MVGGWGFVVCGMELSGVVKIITVYHICNVCLKLFSREV